MLELNKIYQGKGKHKLEELEEIIEELQSKLIDLDFSIKKNNPLINELTELVRDIYNSCFEINKDLDAKNLIKNIKQYLENFSENYNFKL